MPEKSYAKCPVCGSRASFFYHHKKQERRFFLCADCSLVFQEEASLPEPDREQERYSLHQNSLKDRGYVHWLEKFMKEAIFPWYQTGDILDFGSGPEPVLTKLLRQCNRNVYPYDKYFAPQWPEGKTFSMIVLSEVLEHLDDPVSEFRRIAAVADNGCFLTLQTSFLRNLDSKTFSAWWYKDDITHKRFYCASSLLRLGLESGWDLIYQDGTSIAVYKKSRDR